MRLMGALLLLGGIACSPLPQKALSLNPGDAKADVTRTMGTPDDVQFRGRDEAWQYAYVVSVGVCEYRVLWFTDGRLVGSTSYRNHAAGSCRAGMRSVRWEEKPDHVVEVRQR